MRIDYNVLKNQKINQAFAFNGIVEYMSGFKNGAS